MSAALARDLLREQCAYTVTMMYTDDPTTLCPLWSGPERRLPRNDNGDTCVTVASSVMELILATRAAENMGKRTANIIAVNTTPSQMESLASTLARAQDRSGLDVQLFLILDLEERHTSTDHTLITTVMDVIGQSLFWGTVAIRTVNGKYQFQLPNGGGVYWRKKLLAQVDLGKA